MFGENSRDEPDMPVTASEFKQSLEPYDGDSYREKIGSAVDVVWPAPGYRENQRETVVDVVEKLYIEDNDVCLLSAPTGAGKSLLIYAVATIVKEVVGRRAFTTTPLNTLIDQIGNDEFLDDVITVKGRNNYSCVHPQDAGKPVDEAICQRDSNFECEYKQQSHRDGGCPYYGRVYEGQTAPNVVTNLSYLMANSMIPDVADAGFASRELLAVDEVQNIDSFALLFVGFTVGEHVVPIDWDTVPSMPSERASQEAVIDWLQNDLMRVVTERLNELSAKEDSFMMSEKEKEQLDDLKRFNQRANKFLSDVQDHEWAIKHDSFSGTRKIEFEPIKVGRFMKDYMWSQGNKILCASATIPPNFVEEVGLSDMSVGRVDVPSTFPPERRPIITTEAVGKMTKSERDKTIPKMADQIARIADIWDGHKGIVHCNSYKIAERLYDRLTNGVQRRTRLQDGDNREESLQNWIDAPVSEEGRYRDTGGQMFLSVANDEGISLEDDQARFNIVAKASYPFVGDERVSYRLNELNDWDWYNSSALIDLQQAAGRTTRSKEDWSATYLLDTSAVELIERNEHLCEGWFLDAVDCDFNEDVVSPDNGGQSREGEVDRKSSGTGDDDLDAIADDYF